VKPTLRRAALPKQVVPISRARLVTETRVAKAHYIVEAAHALPQEMQATVAIHKQAVAAWNAAMALVFERTLQNCTAKVRLALPPTEPHAVFSAKAAVITPAPLPLATLTSQVRQTSTVLAQIRVVTQITTTAVIQQGTAPIFLAQSVTQTSLTRLACSAHTDHAASQLT